MTLETLNPNETLTLPLVGATPVSLSLSSSSAMPSWQILKLHLIFASPKMILLITSSALTEALGEINALLVTVNHEAKPTETLKIVAKKAPPPQRAVSCFSLHRVMA